MSGLASPVPRPIAWIGAHAPAAPVACLAAGLLLLAFAGAAWGDTLAGSASATDCARADPARACEGSDGLSFLILGTLSGPVAAALGAALCATGAACLLRPRGRIHPEGRRLLGDAARHHAAGGLSSEGYHATRTRIEARGGRGETAQAALAVSLLGGALALLAFGLVAGFLQLRAGLAGLGGATLPGARTVLGTVGACAVGAVAAAFATLARAARWRARARLEESALRQMLDDLEADVLDEVRRSWPAPRDGPDAGAPPL